MTHRIAILAAVAAACTGDKGVDSGTPADTGTAACAETYDGPPVIQEVRVECLSTNTVRFYARTEGWTDDGYVFSQETGNQTPNYSDEHDLTAYDWDACGFEDNLERELSTSADYNAAQRNQSTVFSCEPDVHFDGAGVMTYAFAVNDQQGQVADCLAFGEDVNGMKNSPASDRVNEPSFDLGICSAGQTTR